MLLSIRQMEELDTVIYIKEQKADFKAIKKYEGPLNKTEKGHLAISLKDWSRK